jgi:4'-phosphopantetheinyl transferase
MINSDNSGWGHPPTPILLDDSHIHVWLFELNPVNSKIKMYKNILSESEKQRAEKITEQNTRKKYISSHAIMRKILSIYTNTPAEKLSFGSGIHGKPFLKSPNENYCFNLSHSFEYGLLAIAMNSELGIDIENMNRHVDEIKLSTRFFSENEAKSLKEMDKHQRKTAFFNTWSSKEALLKATGKGISYGLNKFELSISANSPAHIISTSDAQDDHSWILIDLPNIDNYASALAAENKNWNLHCWKWNED